MKAVEIPSSQPSTVNDMEIPASLSPTVPGRSREEQETSAELLHDIDEEVSRYRD